MPKFTYTGIMVSNIEKSIQFYTKELGMKLLFKTKIKETGGKVAWLRSPGSKQTLELNWYPKDYKFGGHTGLDHLCFEVADTYKFSDKLSKKYKLPVKPFVEGDWVLSYIKDPDGNWIELGHRRRKN